MSPLKPSRFTPTEPQGWVRSDVDAEPCDEHVPCMLSRFIAAAVIVLAVLMLAGTSLIWPIAPVAEAAQNGDVDAVRTLLRQGEDVNASQGDGMTALHWAAYQGSTEMAGILMYAGANLEVTTRVAQYTPLLVAARTGHGDVVTALLDAGANARARTSTGVTALHFASAAGHVPAIESLLSHGAEVEAHEFSQDQTPLIFAANRGRVEAIRTLIAAGADPSETSRVTQANRLADEDRIDSALRRDRLEAMATLRAAEQQAVLDMEELNLSPEEAAAAAADEEANAEAVPATAPPELSDNLNEAGAESEEAEGTAAESDDGEDRDVASAPVAAPEPDSATTEPEEEPLSYNDLVGGIGGLAPLHHAVREGYLDAAMALIDAGADVNQKSGGDGSTPMLLATINGHFDLALALMARGADPEIGSLAGVTPLYAAINVYWAPKALYPQPKAFERQEVSYMGFLEQLLQAGVDPNRRIDTNIWYMSYNFDLLGVNVRGSTPFWRAAYATDVPAMQLLVAYGADPEIPTRNPPQRARRGDPPEDHSGLEPVPVGGPGIYPIHAATGVGYGKGFAANSHRHAPDGWLPTVRYLVEELGADVNARDYDGYTPVHHAASRGDNETIRYLVEKGADVTLLARNGRTTADMANGVISRVEPFPETIALLVSLGAVNNNNCLSCE